MPNYVTNIIVMNGPEDQYEKVLEFLRSEERDIDFNKIMPMPDSLKITAGSVEDDAIALYKSKVMGEHEELRKMLNYSWISSKNIKTIEELQELLLERDPDLLEKGKKYVTNIQLYGYSSWYEWCCENWGTKWNACDSWTNNDSFGFDTAWSAVIDLMIIVSRMFPDIEFTYSYADEDFGSNLGRFILKSGNIIKEYIPAFCSDEAYELASEILGYDLRDEWDEDEE